MVDKIYMLHHEEFSKRFDYFSKRLKEENVEYKIINSYHPKDIDYEKLMLNHEYFPQVYIEQIKHYSYHNFFKKISPGSLSLILKHIHAWEDQLNNDYEDVLILEDDCEIPKNFNQYLEVIMREYRHDNKCGLMMVGTCDDFTSPSYTPNDRHIFYHPYQKTRCTHGYIINKKCAQKMINGFKNFNLPIDFKMNEVIQLENINVGWVEPGLKQIN